MHRWRHAIVVLFMIWFVCSSYLCSQWKTLSKEEEYLPKGHFIIVGKEIIEKKFTERLEGDYIDVEIVFGVKDNDKSDVYWWDPQGIGKPIWDSKFNITDSATQISLLKLSEELLELESSQSFIVRNSVKSWIYEF